MGGKEAAPVAVRSRLIPVMLAWLRMNGRDDTELVRRFSLADNVRTDRWVEAPLALIREVSDAVVRELGDAFIGVHIANTVPPGTYGLLEYSIRSAPTIRAA